jgi:insulinase (Peptidase family M16)
MARIESSSLPNGLPLHRVELPTRSLTALVAFDAGARTERPEENGMAHFLEHLVFKGGTKYDDYRKVNQTAETMGAVLNAYTSHDLVAFHITCRAEVAPEAIDLLTDFVGRPKIDAEELDRERGVVIQEIARAHDQPSVVAEHLIDRAAFGEHPLGRPVLGPRSTCARSRATRSSRSARASGRGRAAARSWSATSSTCPRTASWPSCSGASRRSPATAATSRRRRSRRSRWWSRATPTSRTCACPTARRSIRATHASARR